jgi:alkanesulfonate monooxygenase SsuD/methylene tetrahydromethanopterin reductase-like flavin-dependent oxidoreductase (luciferase family)
MRVGVVILPQFELARTQHRWRAVEEMGFAHGWTYDHLAGRDLADEPWLGTIPTLTAATLATTSLRLGTWVVSPNYRHPVPLAKDLMTLDRFSGGRILAGIGAGGLGWDATVLGNDPLPPKDRSARFVEFVQLTDLLLRQSETTWRGTWYSAIQARMHPGCVQRPRLPLIVASNGPRGIQFAAEIGDGWATTGPTGNPDWWAGLTHQMALFQEASASRQLSSYLSVDSGPEFSLTSTETFFEVAGRAAELGFTDILVHWPRHSKQYVGSLSVLEEVARSLGPGGVWTP